MEKDELNIPDDFAEMFTKNAVRKKRYPRPFIPY